MEKEKENHLGKDNFAVGDGLVGKLLHVLAVKEKLFGLEYARDCHNNRRNGHKDGQKGNGGVLNVFDVI